MTPLEAEILARIDRTGPISVHDFMELALGHPEHGYYRTRDPLGAKGDFTTAPEISQMFGELLGLWCAETWALMGRPARLVLAELGPGRGTLMADLLRAADMVPDFRAALSLHLVETSPVLEAGQRQALAGRPAQWHRHWQDLPAGPLLLVANEFVDALPVRQFVRRADGWRERMVGSAGGRLAFEDGPLAALSPPGDEIGAIFETRPAAGQLARDLAKRLAQDGGAALLVDYGHARSGLGDTLQAVRNHAFAPVLEDPGLADLTAHVDFEALAREAPALGPIPQGVFLARLGILERTRLLARANPARAREIEGQCRRLIDPSEMGTLFKALVLWPGGPLPPPGFEALP